MTIKEFYKKIDNIKTQTDFVKHKNFIRLLKILEQDMTSHNADKFEKIYNKIKKDISESEN